jgi:predicted  nucleic acid-binding Zn ribbon protein
MICPDCKKDTIPLATVAFGQVSYYYCEDCRIVHKEIKPVGVENNG